MRAALNRRALLAATAAALPSIVRAQSLRDLVEPPEPLAWGFAGGARSTGWLPLRPGNSLALDGRLNGAPVRMVLDSGAAVCLVDLALARRLGLRGRRARTVRDGVGQASVGRDLADVAFTLGGLELSGAETVAVDLSGLAAVGQPAPVVLGREAFEHLVVDIDAPNRRLAFHAPGAFAAPYGARALPLTTAARSQRRIPLEIEGAADLSAQFDLGSQSALVASEGFAAARGWLSNRPTSTWIAATVAGVRAERTSTVQGLTLAGFALPPAPLETSAAWDAPDLPLVVGLPTLARFRLTTDYARDRLWLLPDADALARPFRKDRSGLACRPAGAGLEVLHVAARSPAARGRWGIGDRIARIDGAPAAEALGFGEAPMGRTFTLTLEDGEVRRLTLADYF